MKDMPIWKKILAAVFTIADVVLLVIIIMAIVKKPEEKSSDSGLGTKQSAVSEETGSNGKIGSNDDGRDNTKENGKDSSKDSPLPADLMSDESDDDLEDMLPSGEIADFTDSDVLEETGSDSGETKPSEDGQESPAHETLGSADEGKIKPVHASGAADDNSGISDMTGRDVSDPDLGDFMWYSEGYRYTGMSPGDSPDAVGMIAYPDMVNGSWKMLIDTDPENLQNASNQKYMTAEISIDSGKVEVTFYWGYMFDPVVGQSFDESDSKPSVLTGTWGSEGLEATSSLGRLTMDDFFECNGKQYGLGHFDWNDGSKADVALIRP